MTARPARGSRARTRLLVALVAAVASGCVQVEGGALEAAWVINLGQRGLRVDCACAQVAAVWFVLSLQQPRGADAGGADQDPCATREGECRFACEEHVGTTRFVIPEGDYAISVVPVGPGGEPLGPDDGIRYPPPVQRTVRRGELTSLAVNLFIVDRSRLAGPDECEEEWLQP